MSKQVLQSLRDHVKTLHQKEMYELHLPYQGSNSVAVSEWELIENFRQHVLGEELNLVKYAPHDITNKSADLNFFTHQFLTHYGTDKDLGRDWFSDQGIVVLDNIWSQLEKILK